MCICLLKGLILCTSKALPYVVNITMASVVEYSTA